MAKTAIEWTDATWNPTTGCDQVSPGCDHCYALAMAKRLKTMGSPDYQTDGNPTTSGPGFGIAMHPHRLDQPLRWTKPRKVFVNSMSDLFHDGVSNDFIAQVWAVMALSPLHTFQVLTKRHGRMRSLLNSSSFQHAVDEAWMENDHAPEGYGDMGWPSEQWPLPNVWLGVSAEDQNRYDLRWPALAATPAVVRWVSAEPLLGPISMVNHGGARPDWVVVGGESGPGARPMHPAWARALRQECAAHRVPFLFKQRGDWTWDPPEDGRPPVGVLTETGRFHLKGKTAGFTCGFNEIFTMVQVARVGKKAAGRLLDGRTWDQYPKYPKKVS